MYWLNFFPEFVSSRFNGKINVAERRERWEQKRGVTYERYAS
jgi:hypothetical protein